MKENFDALAELKRLHEYTVSAEKHVKNELRHTVAWLRDDMDALVRRIDSDGVISSIGEVQGRGGRIDSLCGRLEEIKDRREWLEAVLADAL